MAWLLSMLILLLLCLSPLASSQQRDIFSTRAANNVLIRVAESLDGDHLTRVLLFDKIEESLIICNRFQSSFEIEHFHAAVIVSAELPFLPCATPSPDFLCDNRNAFPDSLQPHFVRTPILACRVNVSEPAYFLQSAFLIEPLHVWLRERVAASGADSSVSAAAAPGADRPPRILLIGLGGGGLAHSFHALHPNSQIIAVELNAIVAELARSLFGVTPDVAEIVVADAAEWIAHQPWSEPFDFILLDAGSFRKTLSMVPPEELSTRAFFAHVRRLLAPRTGVFALHAWNQNPRGPDGALVGIVAYEQHYLQVRANLLAAFAGDEVYRSSNQFDGSGIWEEWLFAVRGQSDEAVDAQCATAREAREVTATAPSESDLSAGELAVRLAAVDLPAFAPIRKALAPRIPFMWLGRLGTRQNCDA